MNLPANRETGLAAAPLWWWPAIIWSFATGLTLYFWHWNFDDAYIVMRVAQNLAAGRGLVYNPGELHFAATSPLYTLVLAAAATLIPVNEAAHLLFLIFLAATSTAFFFYFSRRGEILTAIAASLLIICNLFIYATIGLEISLFWLTALAAIFFFNAGRTRAAGLALGLATLSRPEGCLLAAVLLAFYLKENRKPPPVTAILLFLLPVLIWLVFSHAYFTGGGWSKMLAAKMAQGRSGLFGQGPQAVKGLAGGVIHEAGYLAAAAYLALALAGIWCWGRKKLHLIFLTWAALHLIGLGLLQVPFYPWYYGPVFLYGILLIAQALSRGETAARQRWGRVTSAALITLALGVILVHQATLLASAHKWYRPTDAAYRTMGEILKQRTPPHAVVLSAEIGALGFYSERPMFDFMGILDPAAIPYLKQGNVVWWLNETAPDIVVLHEPYWEMELPIVNDSLFALRYRHVQSFSFPQYYTLKVFVKKASANVLWRE